MAAIKRLDDKIFMFKDDRTAPTCEETVKVWRRDHFYCGSCGERIPPGEKFNAIYTNSEKDILLKGNPILCLECMKLPRREILTNWLGWNDKFKQTHLIIMGTKYCDHSECHW